MTILASERFRSKIETYDKLKIIFYCVAGVGGIPLLALIFYCMVRRNKFGVRSGTSICIYNSWFMFKLLTFVLVSLALFMWPCLVILNPEPEDDERSHLDTFSVTVGALGIFFALAPVFAAGVHLWVPVGEGGRTYTGFRAWLPVFWLFTFGYIIMMIVLTSDGMLKTKPLGPAPLCGTPYGGPCPTP